MFNKKKSPNLDDLRALGSVPEFHKPLHWLDPIEAGECVALIATDLAENPPTRDAGGQPEIFLWKHQSWERIRNYPMTTRVDTTFDQMVGGDPRCDSPTFKIAEVAVELLRVRVRRAEVARQLQALDKIEQLFEIEPVAAGGVK